MKKITLLFFILSTINLYSQCWQSISASGGFTLGVKNDGTLWAWGVNDFGQLGLGNLINKNIPTQIGNQNNWLKVGAGFEHSTAIKTNGTLWAWGKNNIGQLGDGTNINKTIPVQIGNSTNWENVYCGESYTIAKKTNGTLWGWGYNLYGQLGDGTSTSKNFPSQIGLENNWNKITSGYKHSLAIKNDGTLWVWGNNQYGQLGLGNNTSKYNPTQVGTLNNWEQISAFNTGDFSFAKKTDGTIWAWGFNQDGQLGNGGNSTNNPTPIKIGIENDWLSISAGYAHCVATKNNNSLWSWGYNTWGQLGDGTNYGKNTPHQVGTNLNWNKLYVGGGHCFASNTANILFGWGENTTGNLGDGTNISKNIPTSIFNCTSLSINITENINDNLFIFPNPTSEYLNIIDNNKSEIKQIILYNIFGNQILESYETKKVDVSNLRNGIYLVKIIGENSEKTIKLLKK